MELMKGSAVRVMTCVKRSQNIVVAATAPTSVCKK
jgi:hypothetical protein